MIGTGHDLDPKAPHRVYISFNMTPRTFATFERWMAMAGG